MIVAACAAAIACFGVAAAQAQSSGQAGAAAGQFRFLKNSKWYVPTETLPAAELKLTTGRVRALIDQTVWDIDHYRDGYFSGRSVAAFKYAATGEPFGAPACSRLIGSVTPSGHVYIIFVDDGQNTAFGAVRGIGTLTGSDQAGWRFEMQMSTGATSVVAHWSYMDQCKPGEACEAQLPGSDLSLADFLAQCD
jgi:hypothetical protein